MAPVRLQKLAVLLTRSSSRADVLATHLVRLLSTTKGFDCLLRTVYYSLLLLHSQLTRVLSNRYEKLAIDIASKASSQMMPGETLVASIEPPHLELVEHCAKVKATGDAVEEVRMFIRLHGLLDIYAVAKETWEKGKRDPAIKLLTWSKIFATAGYQAFENAAYLTKRGILSSKKWQDREMRLWVWSSRFWLAAVIFDLLKLMRVRQLRYREDWGAELRIEDEKQVKIQSQELEHRWWRSLYSNLGWLPSAIHFSYYDEEQSPVSEAWLGASALVPAVFSLSEAWAEAA